jgi:hypothetical protein
MVGGSHIFGGFNISPSLALRVFEVVDEITSRDVNLALSHVDDDNCDVCKGEKIKETDRDAAQQDRAGRKWTA